MVEATEPTPEVPPMHLRTSSPSVKNENDQGPKFDLILKIQSELGRTFDDLISRAGNTDPESVSFRAQTNDNDLQEIKGFRLWVLRWNIVSLTHHLRRLFDFSSNVILELQPPTTDVSSSGLQFG
ncbi:hypothetical protein Pst134EA_031902 [Puccinia striiformis f. sp. tritici]|uniref:uncharacterized protein n=1 Tax=Puccinia striiformis f. sp. tritici TaxID=168172 RepID=UPI0020072D45|nr:uncharacterized protein Pst134EA_031902 [Puccinia striiformis f. sp. tritici]KAH9444437.1 hypothetical protein Pst134EA_031902 [Puccinia striiformis f. sp. tritici]